MLEVLKVLEKQGADLKARDNNNRHQNSIAWYTAASGNCPLLLNVLEKKNIIGCPRLQNKDEEASCGLLLHPAAEEKAAPLRNGGQGAGAARVVGGAAGPTLLEARWRGDPPPAWSWRGRRWRWTSSASPPRPTTTPAPSPTSPPW